MSRLKERYKSEIKKNLLEKFGYSNSMMIPKMKKVVISMGLAEASKDKGILQQVITELTLLSGQKPIMTKTKIAIANFKSRKDQVIGAKVTLRGKRMYDFLDRFFNISSPRIRDFRGFSRKCDGSGSYSLGLDEQVIFPEINLDMLKKTQGMNITFVTTAKRDEECVELLTQLGMPFKHAQEGTKV